MCLILILLSTTVYASSTEPIDYQIRFTHIDSFENMFNISSKGKATVTSYLCSTNRDIDNAKVTAELQQYKDATWKTIKTWSEKRKEL